MSTIKYYPVHRDSFERESKDSLENSLSPQSFRNRISPGTTISILVVLLAVSLSFNGFFLFLRNQVHKEESHDHGSYFAGLERELPIQIYQSTEYVSENLTEVSHIWEALSGDPGVVALPQDFVSEKRLPHALQFPWDTNKGVYLLQGFHNLHCLRTLFRYVRNAETGIPQSIALIHIIHCLDQLRQDIICNADDTPRYAGYQDPPGTGAGQVRMCKDWSKLEKWSLERTACFKHEDEVPGKMVDRFKFCPDGRVLWPTSPRKTIGGAVEKDTIFRF